ncbi:polyketide-type polyunsaturated fatty acid synthase PfaA [Desulfocicer vacuolatum DSM 3385]|uniref:Polyketide-type polyunsaturated fatty acid synthase PfaA n=1 Tax=Desulfocicer vacuolatum DSM 3385 TaxID=1121400 RepID=A0A1W2CY87_9BACT|nr:type I polyketide synthase [Desulfocicer vacuolatum]SMC90225.1 polyketide-type polyunsaturated fatty acid synthase PfaA [Desulfocicer vacuolatum DSM 3385]
MGSHIVVTPSHICDSKIAIAAINSGETGILDLGYGSNMKNILRSIDLLKYSVGNNKNWGIRWDSLGSPLRSPQLLLEKINIPIPIIILAGILPSEMEKARQITQQYSSKVFLEVTTQKEAKSAQEAKFNGVILKGNEAGGYIGSESSFILLQQLKEKIDIPYWIWGGMGVHTTAAACLAGAEGGVFCEQLWLSDESPFSMEEKKFWENMDGSETICLGHKDCFFRLFSRTGRYKIREYESLLAKSDNWRVTMTQLLLDANENNIFIPCGQDIGLASHLSKTFGSTETILAAIEKNCVEHIKKAKKHCSLAKHSPLAKIHGTTYPILQGPMANISDVGKFSLKVANEGALPFVALSALPGDRIKEILKEVRNEVKNYPWGIGTLGFLPGELRQKQFEVFKKFKPPFAIVAGGRPSLAMAYEKEGISTYLHVPSPGLLTQFIKKGCSKFIFEGRECGGHVGPLSSFVLWESIIHTLLSNEIADLKQIHVIFAGGIHDALSSAMVQTLAAPLAASGVKLGIIMGSAYLFSREAVNYNAITPEYQKQALACDTTHLLQSGIGHASCCMATPFIEKFYKKKQALILSGKKDMEILQELELMNLGRLKIASKGIATSYKKSPDKNDVSHIQVEETEVDDKTQREEGLFMIGQIARLHDKTFSIKKLHTDVTEKSLASFDAFTSNPNPKHDISMEKAPLSAAENEDIAIIGMASFLPESNNNKEYWHNILNQVCAIREIPGNRWDIDIFFDPDRRSIEKSYSKWGGFLKDITFDPVKYSMAPKSLESIDSSQLLALKVASHALSDAGYNKPEFPRKNTAVIFGAGGINSLGMDYGARAMSNYYAGMVSDIPETLKKNLLNNLHARLPKWTSDTFPGVLGNVIAGRISNRFDLGGMNFTCDAACASSFAALDIAVRQLRTQACDAALVGAVDTGNHPFEYIMFSRAQVLSPKGQSLPLDDRADGIVLSEGAAAIVLKRLTDAERDKDRIYAVIKGIGGSSDGRKKSLVSPNAAGQVRAMKIAYKDAGINPDSVDLLEMHGTGTIVGDRVEMQSYRDLFMQNDITTKKHCAVGSVKSMIGHTKITAGLAALIKTSLALEHKILPPTMGVKKPNTKVNFTDSPFYINTETRPWILNKPEDTRKAGLSCFGFGGTNFHIVMEEYVQNNKKSNAKNLIPRDVEIFTFSTQTRAQLQTKIQNLLILLEGAQGVELNQLAYSVFLDSYQYQPPKPDCRLNIVAMSLDDLRNKLKMVKSNLDGNNDIEQAHLGIYYSEKSFFNDSTAPLKRICFLYPGQGSQKINMFKDLIISMPETYKLIEYGDKLTHGAYDRPLSNFIFPTPVFSDKDRRKQQQELNQTQIAQPALGLINLLSHDILKLFGIKPDMVAGHSYGEYVALCTAGVLSRKDLIQLSENRGKLIANLSPQTPGTMAAIRADSETTSHLIEKLGLDVSIANYNSPIQNVISGSVDAIDKAVAAITAQRIPIKKIPVTAAFHTNAMDSISTNLEKSLKKITLNKPDIKVFSNATSQPYPHKNDEILNHIKNHGSQAVRFEKMIQNMYDAGARLFIEVGPGRVLTGLVKAILGDAPFSMVSMDAQGRSAWDQLSHLLASVKTLGIPVDLAPCFKGRGLKSISTKNLIQEARSNSTPGPMAWRIFGGRAEPYHRDLRKDPPVKKKDVKIVKHTIKNEAPIKKQRAKQSFSKQNSTIIQNKERIMSSQKTTTYSPNAAQTNIPGNEVLRVLDQCNKTMAHLFEMQKEQHRTTQQFLRMQESMIQATIHGNSNSNSEQNINQQDNIPAQFEHENPIIVTQAVPPSPTLPTLEKTWPDATPDEKHNTPYNEPSRTFQTEVKSDDVVTSPEKNTTPTEGKKTTRQFSKLPDINEFKQKLMETTCEYTGFPEDMLDLNMNMEVDLGIDSIKKLEIFSALDEQYQLIGTDNEEMIIDELSAINSLGEIIEWYEKKREDLLSSKSMSSQS